MKNKLIVKLLNCFIARTKKNNLTIQQCSNSKFSGFTFIETLTIVGVIGILATAAVVIIDPISQMQKADDLKRKTDLILVQKGLERYYKDFGKYPPNPGNCPQDNTKCKMVRLDGSTADWGQQFKPYISLLPKDPDAPRKTYIYHTNGQAYYLYANLDIGQDPQACSGESACASLSTNGISSTACGRTCNYAVTSPNVSP